MRVYWRCVFLFIFFTSAFLLVVGQSSACFNPTDSFAFEVLLNKPGIKFDLSPFKNAENVRAGGDLGRAGATQVVQYRSHYNPHVAVVLFADSTPEKDRQFLSVKIQVPTKIVNITYPETTIRIETTRSLSFNRSFIRSLGYEYIGVLEEGRLKVEAKRDSISIAIWSIKVDENKTRSGVHIRVLNETLTPEREQEFRLILHSLGIAELWESATIATRNRTDADLEPVVEFTDRDFGAAMKAELKWLKENGIVSGITDSDIQEISEQGRAGLAGRNSRIVFYDGKWVPYHKTGGTLIKGAPDCSGFPEEALPEGQVNLGNKAGTAGAVNYVNLFLIFLIFGAILLIIKLRVRGNKRER